MMPNFTTRSIIDGIGGRDSKPVEPWENYDKYVSQAESVERVLNPILSVLSIILNTSLALYILSKSDLRKFTFLIVAFQVRKPIFL